MINIKTNKEIELMRIAGNIVAKTHQLLKENLRVGISTLELDTLAENFIREQGAIPSFKGYGGFKGSICASINEEVIHGIPSKNAILKEGDIISLDIGANYQGYHGDSAWTYPIGKISKEAEILLKVSEEALFKGLEQVKPNNRIGDISSAIEEHVTSRGYFVPQDYTGHGVGSQLHEEPIIPNYGIIGKGPRIKKGMTLAIEPMVMIGGKHTRVLKNGWTVVTLSNKLSAHFEHSVVVTDEGYEILTKL